MRLTDIFQEIHEYIRNAVVVFDVEKLLFLEYIVDVWSFMLGISLDASNEARG